MKIPQSVVLAIGHIVLLSGCALTTDTKNIIHPDPPSKMYATADKYLTKGQFETAAQKFEELDRDHPYSTEARRAIVMAAYAYFRAGKFSEAIATARRYTTVHPGTKNAAFAHHIIASSYFEEINGPKNDQTNTRKALEELEILKSRYPNSKYAIQSDNRIRIARDNLAANEMEVGRYYLNKRRYTAAINRFKVVVRSYQDTKHIEEALMRLTEVYLAIGIRNEAQNATAILGYNFPNSRWYKDAYDLLKSDGLSPRQDTDSWLSHAWKDIKLTSAR
ncbi:MAG: Outer membrane protein assembly factor BamD [Hyphomicrobiaceae bacterium hypho_1]